MNKPNYALKAEVLSNGVYDEVKDLYFKAYKDNNFTYRLLDRQADEQGREALKLLFSIAKKRKRINERVKKMFDKSIEQDLPFYFITLNFNDEQLKLKADTRRQAVRRYLKECCNEYVANIDFGSHDEYIDNHGELRKATGREHYHAIVLFNNDKRLDFKEWSKRGFVFTEKVRLNTNTKRLAQYVAKLTNHAIKESTKRSVIIYSR